MPPKITRVESSCDGGFVVARVQINIAHCLVENKAVNRVDFRVRLLSLKVGGKADLLAHDVGCDRFLVCREFASNAIRERDKNSAARAERSIAEFIFAFAVHQSRGLVECWSKKHIDDTFAR